MNLIAAVDSAWGLGKNGELLVRIPDDLRRFKSLTWGGTVILGRRTLLTFPKGAPLSGRENIILSRNEGFSCPGAQVVRTPNEILQQLNNKQPSTVWSIGGASVYELLLPYCHTAYITRIYADLAADCFLTNLKTHPDWRLRERGEPQYWENLTYCFCRYENINPLPYTSLFSEDAIAEAEGRC